MLSLHLDLLFMSAILLLNHECFSFPTETVVAKPDATTDEAKITPSFPSHETYDLIREERIVFLENLPSMIFG